MAPAIQGRPQTPRRHRRIGSSVGAGRLAEVLTIAEAKGLLSDSKTVVIRGRMTEALVRQAKERTGITSDTQLLEVALANLAVADDYGDWLVSQRGTVNPDLDLEF